MPAVLKKMGPTNMTNVEAYGVPVRIYARSHHEQVMYRFGGIQHDNVRPKQVQMNDV